MVKYSVFDNTVLMAGILPHDLNPKQLEAACYKKGPLLITAGAGSGKTKTLTSRLLYLLSQGVPAEQIVAITFTNKAAGEMKERILALLPKEENTPFIGTFHSFGARLLRKESRNFGRNGNFTIFDGNDMAKLIKNLVKNADLDKVKYHHNIVGKHFSRIKNELAGAESAEDENISLLFERYEDALKRQNAFDFDDLIEKPVRLLQESRKKLDNYHNIFRYFLVDEYQDINTAQYKLIKLLSAKERNLSVVGDDHQSIYSFRGSDFRNFLNFEKDFPEAKVVVLDQNYRSTQNIVRASSALISNNLNQRPKKLWTENNEGDLIKISGFADAEEEANWLANELYNEDRINSAILYRTNAQSRPIEQALIFADIPYFIYGGLKFYDRKEIKDIVSALKYGINPLDEINKERMFKGFRKTRIKPILENLPGMADNLSPVEFIGYILKETDYAIYIQKEKNYEDRMENIKELISFAGGFSSVSEFVERISLLETTDQPKERSSRQDDSSPVRLMTIHMAKGLEFDNIFLAGASEGLIPHERSIFRENDIEEERRLMYVAMTRAKKKLSISFFRGSSRFLNEIPPELVIFDNFQYKDEDTIYLD
ncbi:MAG: UvrD-helicase domain-containing protein [Candidatus Colwellbacteria bacterium]|jgi:DNA helicase-2/ATP-dependent DNA helicase PcrA|nr:UvrD-helicase domain-containing protein [Candidatus Colwellbacteria bacterium]MDD4818573.1 UvrD-helicase domain-containing protein [Candidatus Colwellbacteria bacterium]